MRLRHSNGGRCLRFRVTLAYWGARAIPSARTAKSMSKREKTLRGEPLRRPPKPAAPPPGSTTILRTPLAPRATDPRVVSEPLYKRQSFWSAIITAIAGIGAVAMMMSMLFEDGPLGTAPPLTSAPQRTASQVSPSSPK